LNRPGGEGKNPVSAANPALSKSFFLIELKQFCLLDFSLYNLHSLLLKVFSVEFFVIKILCNMSTVSPNGLENREVDQRSYVYLKINYHLTTLNRVVSLLQAVGHGDKD
jgi:hypothetical protein